MARQAVRHAVKQLTDGVARAPFLRGDQGIAQPGPCRIARKALPPLDTLTDLRHEVRWLSRELLWQAGRNVGQKTLRGAHRADIRRNMQTLVRRWMDAGDDRMKILCFASAAELGLLVKLPPEECRDTLAGNGDFALRVLFWAAQRRMSRRRDTMTDAE